MLILKGSALNCQKENDFRSEGRKPAFEYKQLSRYRWNVLDLLNIFGKEALTSHLFLNIDMTRVEKMRQELHEAGHHVTPTAFLLKAICVVQKNHPCSRTQYLPGFRTVTYDEVVAGFTVEREIEGEPIVFFGELENLEQKSMQQIADELKAYSSADIMSVKKLREQVQFARLPWLLRQLILLLAANFPSIKVKCHRSTFGFSSLGALGVTTACGPSVCTSVFGVGAIEDRAVVENDCIVVRPMLSLALSYDQRVMDGAQAARFLQELKTYLQERVS